MASAGIHKVTLYSRPRCGLCDEARVVLLAQQVRTPFDLEEISIEGNDDLELEYGVRIPVVLIDGAEEFEYVIDPGALDRTLSRLS
jgi:hypothetical protein